jgi:hypothetical protein
MKPSCTINRQEYADPGKALLPLHRGIDRVNMLHEASRRCLPLLLLPLLAGCFHIPVHSDVAIHDPLQAMLPVEQGETVVIYGENATAPKQSMAGSYFTAGCAALSQKDTIGDLIKTLLMVNPLPGRFAVKHLKDLEKSGDPECAATGGNSILCRLNLSKSQVVSERLRYAIHVKETFEARVHIPLYAMPFGVASCSNKTVLEATVWELPAEKCLGTFSVSAEGEYSVLGYMITVVVQPDTQKDATKKLAREIAERLTGIKLPGEKAD